MRYLTLVEIYINSERRSRLKNSFQERGFIFRCKASAHEAKTGVGDADMNKR